MRQFDRPTPSFCAEMLSKFGQNPYGENIYRVVWSETQFETVGGTWCDRLRLNEPSHFEQVGNFVRESNPTVAEIPEYRRVAKYPGVQRWILEKWLAPSYSREDWYSLFMEPSSGLCYLGPYPETGDFHHCYSLERHGQFMPLTIAVVEYYCRLIEAGKEYSVWQRKQAQEERMKREKRAWENRFDAMFDDAQPAFGVSRATSVTPYRVSPENVQLASVDKLPDWLPRKAGFKQI